MDFNNLSVNALVDSGALVNCLPKSELQKIKSVSPDNILKEMDPPAFKLQVANGDIETPTKTVQLQFELGDWTFKETFIVATKMTGPILGLTFLKNNSAILDVSQALLHFPHLTYAIAADDNETVSRHHKVTKNQLTIMPDQCITTEAGINLRTITNTTGIIHPTEQYSGEPALYPRSQTQKLKYGSPTHHRILSPSKRMQMSRKSLYCHPKKLNNSIHSIRQPSRS